MQSVASLSGHIGNQIGPKQGLRVLHISDLHNRLRGVRLASALAEHLPADVVVNTGDLSGLGPGAEAMLAFLLRRIPAPGVFVMGNHDSRHLPRLLRGTQVLDGQVAAVAGIRFWGYPDPNRPGVKAEYSSEAVAVEAERRWPPPDAGPLVVAVHNAAMAPGGADGVTLVLSGHVHSAASFQRGATRYVRCGSTGGGGPFRGDLRVAVIDLEPGSLHPVAAWLVSAGRRRLDIQKLQF